MREEDIQLDFPEPHIKERLGWKKPLNSMSKAQKKKNKKFQKALGLGGDDVEMSGGQMNKNRYKIATTNVTIQLSSEYIPNYSGTVTI